jgi:hypothetical protein
MVRLASCLLLVALAAATPAVAQSYLVKPKSIGGNPGPAHNYVCPNVERGSAIDCFLDAVRHLYTMCKHVKSIEIIEFGYEKSDEGTNGAKTAYCLDKQKQNMAGPFKAALTEAKVSRQAADMLRGLHEAWIESLARLRWNPGESADEYQTRTSSAYGAFEERIAGIRAIVELMREHAAAAPAARAEKSKTTVVRAKADR